MKVYALFGKSGTGKSYQAMELCDKLGIEAIIDDGLFIHKNNIMAGSSAKREPTKIGAIKTALFTSDIRKIEVVKKIREVEPESMLILGTSKEMVVRIAKRLELPEIQEFIDIEDITTDEQREMAYKQRHGMGKHVVPVPAAQLKKQFSGFFMDPLAVLRNLGHGRGEKAEKSVVRPTYSYLGNFYISEKAVSDIIYAVAKDIPEVTDIKKVSTEKRSDEIRIKILAVMSARAPIIKSATKLQAACERAVDKMTGFNIGTINVEIRDVK